MEQGSYIKMDYSLETAAERTQKVNEIIANTPPERLTQRYLKALADYIMDAHAKQEKKEKKLKTLLTPNRMKTINKNETSFEGLVERLENGEDGLYNMISDNKHYYMTSRDKITEKDLAEIPELKDLHDAIERYAAATAGLRGKKAFAAKTALIDMRRDQYEIKNAYRKPIDFKKIAKSIHNIDLDESITIVDEDVISDGLINLFNKTHVTLILNAYSTLKEDTWDKLDKDMHYLLLWLEQIIDKALKDKYPLYYKLLIYKIDERQNAEIQKLLNAEFGIEHSVEYISALWRNKIPELIVEEVKKDYLEWYYTFEEKGNWKTCGKCRQVKLAHPFFFSKNKTSKDGWYSICKSCRNKKKK